MNQCNESISNVGDCRTAPATLGLSTTTMYSPALYAVKLLAAAEESYHNFFSSFFIKKQKLNFSYGK